MANPYHDEAGRFSSKEEMGAAVDRLYASISAAKNPVQLAEATDAWFELRTEYEAAQKSESSSAAVGSFMHDATEAKRSGAPAANLVLQGIDAESAQIALEKGIRTGLATVGIPQSRSTSGYTESKGTDEAWREEYSKVKTKKFADLNEREVNTLAKMLSQRNAPQSLRDDFYRAAPADAKVAIMEKYMGHPLDSVRISASLARGLMVNGGENNPELVSYALSSDLPFTEKAALADNHGRLAYIAARDPHAFTDRADDPEVEQRLLAELHRGARNSAITDEQRGGWQALALSSELRSTRDEVIEKFAGYDNYDRRVVSELAQNQYLNFEQEAQILQSAAWNDAAHFSAITDSLAGAAYKLKGADRKAHSQRLEDITRRYTELVHGGDTSAYVALTPSQARSSRAELDRLNAIESPTFQEQKRLENLSAVFEAQPDAYAASQRQIAQNDAALKQNYVEKEHFANERLRRTLQAATIVRAADIAAGEYVNQYYSA